MSKNHLTLLAAGLLMVVGLLYAESQQIEPNEPNDYGEDLIITVPDGVIWQPTTVNFCGILEFTPCDAVGEAKVVWLDPNRTQIDEGARWFFEEILKDMCDEYIVSEIGRLNTKKPSCEYGECPFCEGTGCKNNPNVFLENKNETD